MELDENGRPQPTGKFETLEADSLILALGQDTDTAFPREGARHRVRVGPHGHRRRQHDDRPRRHLRRRRHGAERALGDDCRRARQARGTAHRCLPRGKTYRRGTAHTRSSVTRSCTSGTAPMRRSVEQDRCPSRIARPSFDEIMQNLSGADALFEAQRCLSCGNCFECDGCYGACPEARHQARTGQALQIQL